MREPQRIGPRTDRGYKRPFDVVVAGAALLLFSPALALVCLAVWLQDRRSPFYLAPRVALNGGNFTMIKFRSMVQNADRSGVSSTGADDARITRVGGVLRKLKLDELPQLLNVLAGDMSVVGPRPNTRAWGVDLYTERERAILSVRPGITDLASIVFSDEGTILKGAAEPDLLYNRVIRPWKSRLALWYVDRMSLGLDLRVCWLTALAIVNRRRALDGVVDTLTAGGADAELIEICRRLVPLPPAPPPGGQQVEDGSRYRVAVDA